MQQLKFNVNKGEIMYIDKKSPNFVNTNVELRADSHHP